MNKHVLIPIADGTEEIEAVCMIDTLRRAGISVTVASVMPTLEITASRGVKITADTLITDCTDKAFDMIALPGGMPGSTHLAECTLLIDLLKKQNLSGQWIAAICAAPAVVLHPNGLLRNIKATCYPAMQDQLDPAFLSQNGVEIDQTCVTGQGPGFALKFALTLVEVLAGSHIKKSVAKGMLII